MWGKKPKNEKPEQRVKELEERAVGEQSLKNSQHLLQTIIDTIEGEVFVKDTNGKYLFVNKAFGKDFGVDPNDVIGKDDYFIFSPEVAAKLQENDTRIMAAKKAENIEESGLFEGRKVTYLTNKVPLMDDHGKVLGICGVGLNVTRQKKMDEALEEVQRFAKLGNWQWDILTNRLEWSDEIFRILGLTPQQFSATYDAFFERVHPDDRNTVKAAMNQALEEPSAEYDIQHRIVKPDGSLIFVHDHGKVTFDENGKPVRMIGTIQDISAVKTLEAESQRLRIELIHLDRMTTMGAMIPAIAHEINQPLTAILSNAQAALRFLRRDRVDTCGRRIIPMEVPCSRFGSHLGRKDDH